MNGTERPERDPELTPEQIDAVLEVGRSLRAAVLTMWDAVRPALVAIGEAMQAAHERGCLPGNDGTCVVCHNPTGQDR